MPRPRVALVHDWLTGMRGGEKVLEAIASLFPESPIFTLFHFPGSVSDELESHPIYTSSLQNAPGIRKYYRHYLPFFPTAVEELDVSSYDVVLSSSHAVVKSVIPGPGAVHLCYCHTPMRYAWDQEKAYFPDQSGPIGRLRALILAQLRRWDAATAERVDGFIANSSFVAKRIERYYGRSSDVIYPPVDTEFYTPGEVDGGDYCLMVSALAPYKRIDLAIEACRRIGRELRVVGTGPERQRLERVAGDGVRLVGSVAAEDLRELYRNALCVVQPGIEDFGISSVESLACGTPVVSIRRGGVLDIVDDGEHGTLYDEEHGSAGLAEAIDKTAELRFNKLNLRARAEDFSMARFLERFEALLTKRIES